MLRLPTTGSSNASAPSTDNGADKLKKKKKKGFFDPIASRTPHAMNRKLFGGFVNYEKKLLKIIVVSDNEEHKHCRKFNYEVTQLFENIYGLGELGGFA